MREPSYSLLLIRSSTPPFLPSLRARPAGQLRWTGGRYDHPLHSLCDAGKGEAVYRSLSSEDPPCPFLIFCFGAITSSYVFFKSRSSRPSAPCANRFAHLPAAHVPAMWEARPSLSLMFPYRLIQLFATLASSKHAHLSEQ